MRFASCLAWVDYARTAVVSRTLLSSTILINKILPATGTAALFISYLIRAFLSRDRRVV